MTKEDQIKETRKELEPLTDEQLILRVLAALAAHMLPYNEYYQTMTNILRKRSER